MSLATINMVADEFQVSVSTVRAWMRQGLLTEGSYAKIAKTYRFDLDRLRAHFFKQPMPEKKIEVKAPVQLELDLSDLDKDM